MIPMNEIDYSDTEEWKKFVENDVVPLRESATILDEYWNYLREHIDITPLKEIEKNEALQIVLLGGMKEGNYLDGSVAKFYKDFFGVSFSENVPAGIVYNSPFHEFVTGIIAKTKEVMDSANTKGISVVDVKRGETNYEELLRKPEEVVRLIEDFYNKCAKITPNYNEYTLFVLNIRTITEGYFNAAFPWLWRKFEEVKELLGLDGVLVVRGNLTLKVEALRSEHYIIFGHGFTNLGYGIKELYEFIWEINRELKSTFSQYFDEITDLKHEFLTRAKDSIAPIHYEIVKSYDEMPTLQGQDYDYGSWSELNVNLDGLIVDYSHKWLKKDSNVFDFLDEISSLVFVGLVNFRSIHPAFGNAGRIQIAKIT